MYLFTIEGNIGSGKSTFLDALKENLTQVYGIPVIYIPEPVKEWEEIKSEDGKNMIELFYNDQNKYAFSFQMMAYITRLHYLRREIAKYPKCILISERSLMADYHVFAQMLYESGHISLENYQIYKKWFWEFIKDIPVTGIVYLKTSPEVCFERCTNRARKGESISLEYLTTCSNMHEKWLDEDETPVLHLLDNTKEEIESIELFIKCEIEDIEEEYGYDDAPPLQTLAQLASLFALFIVMLGYLFRIYVIYDRITS
jgi:deoxyadenosine/deoxycytidine kinase